MDGCFGDPEQLDFGLRGLGLLALGSLASEPFALNVGRIEFFLWHNGTEGELSITWIGDSDALGDVVVVFLEVEAVHDQPSQQAGVAWVGDFHFSQHPSDDDLDVFIVDFHTLRTVDLLDFVEQVLLYSLFAADSQDIVGDQGSLDESLSSLDDIARVDQESFSWRYQVFDFLTAVALDENRSLAPFTIFGDFDGSVDFSHDGRIFGFSSFEDFGNPWQTPGDVSNAGGFAWHFRKLGTCVDLFAFGDVDHRLIGQVVHIDGFSVCIFENDLRVEFPTRVHDGSADVSAWVFFAFERFAFGDIDEANFTASGRQDGDLVRVPFAEHLGLGDLLIFGNQQSCTDGDLVAFEFTTTGIDDCDFAVSRQNDVLTVIVSHETHFDVFDDTALLRLDVAFFHGRTCGTTDVEGTHG